MFEPISWTPCTGCCRSDGCDAEGSVRCFPNSRLQNDIGDPPGRLAILHTRGWKRHSQAQNPEARAARRNSVAQPLGYRRDVDGFLNALRLFGCASSLSGCRPLASWRIRPPPKRLGYDGRRVGNLLAVGLFGHYLRSFCSLFDSRSPLHSSLIVRRRGPFGPVLQVQETHRRAAHDGGPLPRHYFPFLRRSAQYLVIRSDTSFRWAALIGLRRRRLPPDAAGVAVRDARPSSGKSDRSCASSCFSSSSLAFAPTSASSRMRALLISRGTIPSGPGSVRIARTRRANRSILYGLDRRKIRSECEFLFNNQCAAEARASFLAIPERSARPHLHQSASPRRRPSHSASCNLSRLRRP